MKLPPQSISRFSLLHLPSTGNCCKISTISSTFNIVLYLLSILLIYTHFHSIWSHCFYGSAAVNNATTTASTTTTTTQFYIQNTRRKGVVLFPSMLVGATRLDATLDSAASHQSLATSLQSTFATNNTCYPGEDATPNTYDTSKIGRYCTQWSEAPSCCTQKTIDESFWDFKQNFKVKRECGIQTDPGSECEEAKYSIRCFKLCATVDQQESKYTNGTFSICSNLARHIYLRCKDYMECEAGACEDDENSRDGCVSYSTKYTVQTFTEQILGYRYVDEGSSDLPCFSGAASGGDSRILKQMFVVLLVSLLCGSFGF